MRFNTLPEWLAWQEKLHPDAIDLGLDRVAEVWNRLKSNRYCPRVITVGGTNGKGSTLALLEAIYSIGGYKVGAYTSPHLIRYNERIRINQQEVSADALCLAFDQIDQARQAISLTYFEFGTLAALLLFQQANLEVILLEVGLGGRLDAVNVIDADCAVITSIDFDHCDYLGNTRELIGFEKAGIFRANQPAVSTETDLPETVTMHAAQLQTSLYQLGEDILIRQQADSWDCLFPNLDSGAQTYALPYPAMRGYEQLNNATAAISACTLMRQKLPVSTSAIRQALQTVNLPGRFAITQKKCRWVLDVAHNAAASSILAANVKRLHCRGTTYAIFAAMADKDVASLLMNLDSLIQHWFIVNLDNERAMSQQVLAQTIRALKLHSAFTECDSVDQAVRQIVDLSKEDDLVVVYGSFVTVGQTYLALESIK